jgi:hypothetical protein
MCFRGEERGMVMILAAGRFAHRLTSPRNDSSRRTSPTRGADPRRLHGHGKAAGVLPGEHVGGKSMVAMVQGA